MPRRRYWRQWLIVAVALASVIGITGAAIAATTSYPVTVTITAVDGTVLGTTTVNIPVPTVTVTATVTATPTTAATATPTPTPTTTSATATVAPIASGAISLWGVHDRVYDGVTFDGAGTGGADSSGVIFIGSGCYNITFRNCTIMPNRDGVGNGIKVYSGAGTVHDIRFENCRIMTQPRMGFECIGRGGGYYNVDVIGCTFEVQGSEVISYDGDGGSCGSSLVQGNLCKGGGASTKYPWRQGWEVNGVANMTFRDNILYSCGSSGWNCNGPAGDCGWVFTNNTIDFSLGTVVGSTDGNPVYMNNVSGGVFANNSITNKLAWRIAYFSNCRNMDWRGTTWSGPNATPYETGSSGNLF